jgi:uncharacterized protein YcnI
MKRFAVAVAIAGLLGLPAIAFAHISLHPNEIPAGAFVTVNVRVPGEQPGAYAYKVVMQIPPGFTAVDVQNIPGWTATETTTTLKKPLQTPDGPVDQVVSQIGWTGDRSALGRIENGYFVQFPIDMTMPSNLAGHSLTFKTVEFYSNGQNAYWIGPPSATYPAPTIDVTTAGGVIEDVAGNEAGPTPGFVPTGQSTTPTASSGGSDTLAIVAVILAAVAVGISAVAMTMKRRPSR